MPSTLRPFAGSHLEVQGTAEQLNSRTVDPSSPSRLLKNPLFRRLLKKAQVQGGARSAD